MKYESEINELLNIAIPKESWMTESEHIEIINESLNLLGITRQSISYELEKGVEKGYTVEQQIAILKIYLKFEAN